MKRTFEQFLEQEVHYKLFPEVLDDDIPDHFSDWLGEMEIDNLLEWGELYGKEQYLAGKEEVLKSV